MVKDTGKHLTILETSRSALESLVAEAGSDENITLATQTLSQNVKSYKDAAAHVKRAAAKPKPKAKKTNEAEEPNPAA